MNPIAINKRALGSHFAIERYLTRHRLYPPQLEDEPSVDLGLAVVIPCYAEPAIDATLASLTGQPDCLIARMSGSGATCFGLFASTVAASRAAANLCAAHSSWWVVAGSTL